MTYIIKIFAFIDLFFYNAVKSKRLLARFFVVVVFSINGTYYLALVTANHLYAVLATANRYRTADLI